MQFQMKQSQNQTADFIAKQTFPIQETQAQNTIEKKQNDTLKMFLKRGSKYCQTHWLKFCLLFLITILIISINSYYYYINNTPISFELKKKESKTQNSQEIKQKVENNKNKLNTNIPEKKLQNHLKQSQNQTIYTPVLLSEYSAALCLDGTPGSYYISKNSHEDRTKFYLHFKGGAWCGNTTQKNTLQSCYERSKTSMGSSSKWHKKQTSIIQGFSSLDQRNNFKNWTKVVLNYCDGSGHQGTRKEPVQYNGHLLYFRGHNITIAQFQSLEKNYKLFSNATEIVVSGASAGGLAAYMWTNYVAEKAKKAKVLAVIDSGIFFNFKNVNTGQYEYRNGLQNLMKYSNAEIDIPVPQCIQKFKDQKVNCFFAQNIYMYVKVPTFHMHSLYDRWSIQNILFINCILQGQKNSIANCSKQQRNQIEKYHEKTIEIISQMGKKSFSGVWAPSCVDHGYLRYKYFNQDFRIPQNSQYSAAQSVRKWMYQHQTSDNNNVHIDLQQWPSNKPCSGL